MNRFVPFALATISFVACTSGGGFFLSDAGVPVTGEEKDATAKDSSTTSDSGAKKDSNSSTTETDYAATCSGFCEKAQDEFSSGCDDTKCRSSCQSRANQAAGSCDDEWASYLECAVGSGQFTSCGATGKVNVNGCGSEESILNACLSKPRTCVSNCASDQECQSSCPISSAAIACCDHASGVCFQSSTSTCPVPVSNDAGIPQY